MKKRILAALVCAMMAFSLAGCAEKEDEPTSKRDKPKNDESSYSENSGDPGGDSDTTSVSDSNTSSNSDDKPFAPETENVDWLKVHVVDEMDLDYKIIESGDIDYSRLDKWFIDEAKEKFRNGCVLITSYFGDAEYIKLPNQIESKSCILINNTVNWGENAKAIKFSDGCCGPIGGITLCDNTSQYITIGYGSNITEAVVPDSWKYISKSGGNLDNINTPKETRCIPSDAFKGCSKLNNVTFHENIEYIKEYAFSDCISLEKINFPRELLGEAVLGKGCFEGCTSLKTVELPEGCIVETDDSYGFVQGAYIFSGCTSLEKASVPASMKYVVAGMFSGCTALTEVKLADGIEKIYGSAFSGCTSLKSIDIPDSVTYIERNAFYGCTDIEINFKGKTYNEKNVEKIYGKDLSNM